jgi:hypothetical protein
MPVRWPSRLRISQACLALTVWFALLLQLDLSIEQSIAKGDSALHGVWIYLAFFTILTNLLVAIVLSVPVIAPGSAIGRSCLRPATIAGVAANIMLVCIGYNLLLRQTWHPHGAQLVADILMHDVIPLLFVAYAWLVGSDPGSFGGRMRWAAWPIAYFAYMLARGLANGFYPYPFMNVTSLGYGRVLVNAIGLLAGYFLIAASLTVLDRVRRPAPVAG